MRIGVLSDTHGKLPRAVLEGLAGVDAIIHAGDLGSGDVLRELQQLAPVYAVRGNVDHFAGAQRLPLRLVVELDGVRIGVTHGHLQGKPEQRHAKLRQSFAADRVHVVVYGHSHLAVEDPTGGVLVLNPGSAGDPRRGEPASFALLHVENGQIRPQLIRIPV